MNKISRSQYLKLALSFLLVSASFAAPPNGLTVYHPASQIIAGIFPENYTVNGTLNITPTTTAGTNLFVNSTGALSIGAAVPLASLSVTSNDVNYTAVFKNINSAHSTGIKIAHTSANQLSIDFDSSDDGVDARWIRDGNYFFHVYDEAAQASRFAVTAGGRVGIGAASPDSSLAVVGNLSTTTGAVFATSSGSVGIGTTTPSNKLTVAGNTNIDNTYGLIVGHTTKYNFLGWAPEFQVLGTNKLTDGKVGIGLWEASSEGPYLVFGKSRNAAIGSWTIVQNGDTLGNLVFAPDDGTGQFTYASAKISGEIDGTPGAADVPGRIVFYTTADGASVVTERMRITSSGNVGINTTTPNALLHVNGSGLSSSGWGYFPVIIQNRENYPGILFRNATGADLFAMHADSDLGFGFGYRNSSGSDSFSNAIYVSSGGRVGVNTTLPVATLGVSGQIQASGLVRATGGAAGSETGAGAEMQFISGNGGYALFNGYNRTSGAYVPVAVDGTNLSFLTSGNTKMFISAAGVVGINTTNPQGLLHVERGGDDTSTGLIRVLQPSMVTDGREVNVAVGKALSVGGSGLFGYRYDTTSGDETAYIAIYGDAAALNVRKGGNVGINTTTPTQTLQVGNSTFDNLGVGSAGGPYLFHTINAFGGGSLGFNSYFDGTSYRAGATGGAYLYQHDNAGNLYLYAAPSVSAGAAQTYASRVTYTLAGRVGINTTVPGGLLHINNSGSDFFVGNGAVGIGTLAPSGALNTYGTGGGGDVYFDRTDQGPSLALRSQATGTDGKEVGQILFKGENTAAAAIDLGRIGMLQTGASANNGIIYFSTSNAGAAATEKMRIDNTGNVGIGTTTPNQALEINRSSGNTILSVGNSAGGAEAQVSLTNTGTADASISRFIATVQSTATTNSDPFIDFNVNGGDRYVVGIDNSDSDKFGIWENSNPGTNPRLIIDTTGKVGINTTVPGGVLHINNSGSDFFVGNGAVGIGRTGPIQKLDVRSGSSYTTASLVPVTFFGSNDASNPLGVVMGHSNAGSRLHGYITGTRYGLSGNDIDINVDDGTGGMTIQYQGNVGIGTVVPSASLHVNGTLILTNQTTAAQTQIYNNGTHTIIG